MVVLGDIVVDGLDQMLNGTKTTAANGLSSDISEPAFDLINPGAARGGKMQNVSRPTSKPVAHVGRLVSGQIIQQAQALTAWFITPTIREILFLKTRMNLRIAITKRG